MNLLKADIANLKPPFSTPRISFLLTLTSSKIILHVEDALIPSFSSFLPSDKPTSKNISKIIMSNSWNGTPNLNQPQPPSVGISTINAVMPRYPLFRSVLANTMTALASWAFVTHALVPFSIHPLVVEAAVVFRLAASLPLPIKWIIISY